MFASRNPDLRPESIMNYEISFSQHLARNDFFYGINLFHLDGDNTIQTVFTDGKPMNVNTGELQNNGIEATISYRMNQSWSVNTNYSWLHMKYPVVAAPEHKTFLGVNYSKRKCELATGFQYISGLYTSVDSNTKESFILWNLRVRYQLGRMVSLLLNGENLLAQQYEINAGYPMPKATINGGISINF
jgi:outer membrane receptor protein involved in Fe transport